MDDPVAKLMHMGKETCRKLADLHTAAQQASMELDLEQHLACVEKVSGLVLTYYLKSADTASASIVRQQGGASTGMCC